MDHETAAQAQEDGDAFDVSSTGSGVRAGTIPPTPEEDKAVNELLTKILTDEYESFEELEPLSDEEVDRLMDDLKSHFENVTAATQPTKLIYSRWKDPNRYHFLRETFRWFPKHAHTAVEICKKHKAHVLRLVDVLAMRYIYPFNKNFLIKHRLVALGVKLLGVDPTQSANP
ncbi:hypothetical protein HDU96_004707, partial [Phlyctochytrium bullatum]